MKPHSWQRKSVRDIQKAFKAHKRVLYVAPQGAGKTLIASLVSKTFKRILWLTPTRETTLQAVDILENVGLHTAYLLYDAPKKETHPRQVRVHVGTVASVRTRDLPKKIDLIVIDEAHHTAATTWTELVARYPHVPRLGLTGSPWRLDGKPLREHFDVLVQGPQPSTLVAEGHLSHPLVYTWDKHLVLPKGEKADYSQEVLQTAAEQLLVGDIYDTWKQRAHGWQTIVFASTVAHSKDIVEGFLARGVAAEHIDSTMNPSTRAAKLERFETGVTTVLSTVGVLSEGWDMPIARCMISARPMRSITLWLQQCGRVMRAGSKKVILDHAGNALRLLHPATDREWSLTSSAKNSLSLHSVVLVPCPYCAAMIAPQCKTCPECQTQFQAHEQFQLTLLAGNLVPLHAMTPKQLWGFFVEKARWKGTYIDYAERSYREVTGQNPNPEWYPTDKRGFGDRDILRKNAKWLGRPRAAADAELAALRARGQYLPHPRPRMPPQGIRRLIRVPETTPLADAAIVARQSIRKKLLRMLTKCDWNISKACDSLGFSHDTVITYCNQEYQEAKQAGLVIAMESPTFKSRRNQGIESLQAAATRYQVAPETIKYRLRAAGVALAFDKVTRAYLLQTAEVDRVMREKGPVRSRKWNRSNHSPRTELQASRIKALEAKYPFLTQVTHAS